MTTRRGAGLLYPLVMSTNHKDIGILLTFHLGLVGLLSRWPFTVFMRIELMEPGVQHMCMEGLRACSQMPRPTCTPNGHLWNVLITYPRHLG